MPRGKKKNDILTVLCQRVESLTERVHKLETGTTEQTRDYHINEWMVTIAHYVAASTFQDGWRVLLEGQKLANSLPPELWNKWKIVMALGNVHNPDFREKATETLSELIDALRQKVQDG